MFNKSMDSIQEHECVSEDVGDIGCCRVVREGLPVAYSVSDPEMRTGHPLYHPKDLKLRLQDQEIH